MSDRVLADLADLTVGHVGPMASEYVDDGVPFIRSLNVRPFRIELEGVKYIPERFHQRLAKSALTPGDVVVVRTGAPGTAAVIPESLPVANCSDVVIVRPGPDLDSRYLAYLINSVARSYIDSRTVGAVQQHFNVGAAKGIPIPAATLDEQRRIVAVLGAIDELIETDRSQIARLEDVARTVAATAPEIVELRAFAAPVATKQVRPSGVVEHYSLPAFDEGAMPERVAGEAIQSNKLPLTEPCVLVSRLNPKWERCWMAYPGANAVASTEFVPLTGKQTAAEEVWAVASAAEFWDQMRTHVTGTTGSHQRVDKAAVLTLLVPDVRSLPKSARQQVIACVQNVRALREEIVDLTRARDELLPLLMSRKVRVSDGVAVA